MPPVTQAQRITAEPSTALPASIASPPAATRTVRGGQATDAVPALQTCRLGRRTLPPYRRLVHEELYQEIEELGRGLRGLHVIRINATPQGGGVAEILQRLVPLLRSVGIDAQWRVMPPDEPFFAVSKHLHNLLQGAHGTLTGDEQRIYREHNERTYAAMAYLHPDLWEIHDPQPAAAGAWLNHGVPKVWRCHIDTAAPNPAAAAFLRPYLAPYEAHVYSHASYALPGAPSARAVIIEPAIDPLQLKNRRLAQARTRAILTWLGLDPQRPLVAQVARLDPWKDPCGVIDAFRLARARVPGLQLALLGVMAAQDDPEAAAVYRTVQAHAGADPDIHIYVDPAVVGDEEVAAVQSGAEALLQKSLREGFGLSATEAMWKGRPLIVGDVGGLRQQVAHGHSGYRVQSVAACADYLVALLQDRRHARRLARAARASVRARYLLPRLLRDQLRLYRDLVQSAEQRAAGDAYAAAAD